MRGHDLHFIENQGASRVSGLSARWLQQRNLRFCGLIPYLFSPHHIDWKRAIPPARAPAGRMPRRANR